jgi:hypothetical protein
VKSTFLARHVETNCIGLQLPVKKAAETSMDKPQSQSQIQPFNDSHATCFPVVLTVSTHYYNDFMVKHAKRDGWINKIVLLQSTVKVE